MHSTYPYAESTVLEKKNLLRGVKMINKKISWLWFYIYLKTVEKGNYNNRSKIILPHGSAAHAFYDNSTTVRRVYRMMVENLKKMYSAIRIFRSQSFVIKRSVYFQLMKFLVGNISINQSLRLYFLLYQRSISHRNYKYLIL